MDMQHKDIALPPKSKNFTLKQVMAIMVAAMLVTAVVVIFTIKIFFFPAPFKPVVLNAQEEQQLSRKLAYFEDNTRLPDKGQENKTGQPLQPEKYAEDDSSRKISLSEREINALIAKNTDLADKVAVDLAKDMLSIKILIPLDPDFPILGGKPLKVKAGAEIAFKAGHPVVRLKGVSLMGIPMPGSWLGGLKNVDLVEKFAENPGFWRSFAEGVEAVIVEEGQLQITLKN